jgi:tellurite methyltransferase
MCPPDSPAFWEAGYATPGVSTMGGPNHDIVELSGALPPRARILDLGCGEGRNAFYLAGLGHDVTAVDISAAGIAKLAELAKSSGLTILTEVRDLNEYSIEGEWDLVMAHGVIDYLENAVWRELCAEIRRHTVPGGFNAYTCMLFTDEHPAPKEFRDAGFKHTLTAGELVATYDGWEIVRHDRYVKWDQHPGIPIHCHPVDKLVARRPDAAMAPYASTVIPVGNVALDRGLFDSISMGLEAAALRDRCGKPFVIDTYVMPGTQMGVANEGVVHTYELELWYYGMAVMYVINGRVWGRAIYESEPVRVTYH